MVEGPIAVLIRYGISTPWSELEGSPELLITNCGYSDWFNCWILSNPGGDSQEGVNPLVVNIGLLDSVL